MASPISCARGIDDADTVFSNALLFDPFTCEWIETGFAVKNGIVVGTGNSYRGDEEIDLKGARVVPGFIDAHVHVESSLLNPFEYSRLVAKHGTTTVIADPHEIANVCGKAGIDYMISSSEYTAVDILVMLPSCVPATPFDESYEVLDSGILSGYRGLDSVAGLGEMMNAPGVLNEDQEVLKKIDLFTIVDGHAPGLTGINLNAYIVAGPDSEHEATTYDEGLEKLRKGMYIYIREGSTERNLSSLVPLVKPHTSPRISFCTDDRHADMLIRDGHIDDCIRKAIKEGTEPETAYRIASLSPAERFMLRDRGAISPGRIADFVVLEDFMDCKVSKTFKKGKIVPEIKQPDKVRSPDYSFRKRVPEKDEISISGSGPARIIGICPGQIATRSLQYDIDDSIPDTGKDIIKVVVASRYNENNIGVGLVHGLSLKKGAIACSISHDSHNIIAAGTDDDEIITVIGEVIRTRGGMAAVSGKRTKSMPLSCAGLMSDKPYEIVHRELKDLNSFVSELGGIENPFMYLSFLALTVIPELRITSKGLFDNTSFSYVTLFLEEH